MDENKEKKEETGVGVLGWIMYILGVILTFYAIFLSFRRNNGFHFGAFLAALIFSPIYVIYAFAVPINQQQRRQQQRKQVYRRISRPRQPTIISV